MTARPPPLSPWPTSGRSVGPRPPAKAEFDPTWVDEGAPRDIAPFKGEDFAAEQNEDTAFEYGKAGSFDGALDKYGDDPSHDKSPDDPSEDDPSEDDPSRDDPSKDPDKGGKD